MRWCGAQLRPWVCGVGGMAIGPSGCGCGGGGLGCALQGYELGRGAAGLAEAGAVCLHGAVLLEPGQRLAQELGGPGVGGRSDAVVHPLALASRLDDPRAAQVGQVAADLGLRLLQNLDEVADAKLLVAHQVEQAQAGGVSQRLKEAFHVEARWLCAAVSLPWFTYTP